jgi:hypothetical protein
MADMKARLKEKQTPHDVAEADALLKQHSDLYDDMAANRGRYELLRRRYCLDCKWFKN